MSLNNKQQKTLQAIFDKPTRSNIRWADIEKLLVACGGDIKNTGGSIVSIKLMGMVETYHRPHPGKEAYKTAVDRVRVFLQKAGIKP